MGCNQRILTNKTKILRNVQIHIFNTLKKKHSERLERILGNI